MKPACDARISRPNTISSARTTAVMAMYTATMPRPGVAGAAVYDVSAPGARTVDAGMVMDRPSYGAEVTVSWEVIA
jgi:hypothetical protein